MGKGGETRRYKYSAVGKKGKSQTHCCCQLRWQIVIAFFIALAVGGTIAYYVYERPDDVKRLGAFVSPGLEAAGKTVEEEYMKARDEFEKLVDHGVSFDVIVAKLMQLIDSPTSISACSAGCVGVVSFIVPVKVPVLPAIICKPLCKGVLSILDDLVASGVGTESSCICPVCNATSTAQKVPDGFMVMTTRNASWTTNYTVPNSTNSYDNITHN